MYIHNNIEIPVKCNRKTKLNKINKNKIHAIIIIITSVVLKSESCSNFAQNKNYFVKNTFEE